MVVLKTQNLESTPGHIGPRAVHQGVDGSEIVQDTPGRCAHLFWLADITCVHAQPRTVLARELHRFPKRLKPSSDNCHTASQARQFERYGAANAAPTTRDDTFKIHNLPW
jgi:hypothetical protein